MSGNYAYVVWTELFQQNGGLVVIDFGDLTNPQRVGGCAMGGAPSALAVSGRYAYVAAGEGDLHVFDVSDPASPRLVGDNSTFTASAVMVTGERIYLTTGFRFPVGFPVDDGLVILERYQPPPSLEPPFRFDATGFRLFLQATAGQTVRLQRSAALDREVTHPKNLREDLTI